MMFSLKGMNALVTGASGGIGAVIAEKLAAQGANVALSGTRIEALEAAQEKVKAVNSDVNAEIFTCKLSDNEEVEKLIPSVIEKMGGLDILVNNAGITRDALTIRMSDAQWEEVMQVNLTAAFRLSRAAIKFMTSKRFGRIIQMGSVVGMMGNAGQANYCASKAGLVGMSKAMAHECAKRGVTVNSITPGFISTPMTEVIPEKFKEKILGSIPMGKMGMPADIAAAAAFLASKEAGYITGQTLHVNGGMDMI